MTEIAVVPATLDDAEAIARLHGRCFTPAWSAGEIGDMLAHQGTIGLLIFDARACAPKVVAFVMGRVAADEAEILSIAVADSARRRGLGLRLIAALSDQARTMGAHRLYLEVAAGNAAAIALYERQNFRRLGVRRGYYRYADRAAEDAILFGRDLV